jgi:pyrroline-5-carboxylate reductase
MSVWTAASDVSNEHTDVVREMLKTLGQEIYVSEGKYLDMATALSASGPAYVFLFLEALIDAGVYLGLPRDMAQALAIQTIHGSAILARESGKHPAELRNMVTSPGGTTAEALLTLEEEGFRGILINAVIAAHEKAITLGEED